MVRAASLAAPEFLQLAPGGPRSYFRGMKRISLFLLGAVCLGFPGLAQDNAARAAAEREAAEERYKLLNSAVEGLTGAQADLQRDRKSTRLNSSHSQISYAVFCLKKKK